MHKTFRRSTLITLAAGTLAAWMPWAVQAQGDAYPTRPVKIVVPYSPGGTTDTVGRIVAEELGKELKQPFIIDNRAGAGGSIGSIAVANSPADGYTLLISGPGSNAFAHALTPSLPYDSNRDFVHISQVMSGPNVLVVHPSFTAKTLQELIAQAKANPGKLDYANSIASSGHLSMELLKQKAGVNIQQVPYKGSAPALADVLAGQVPMTMTNQDTLLPYVRAGKLLPLAVTSAQRNPLFPDVPTVAESGFPGFSVVSWVGLSAPKGTPKPIVDKLEAAMVKVFSAPAVRARLESQGFVMVASNSKEYTAFIASEIQRWTQLVKEVGIKGE